MFVPLLIFVSLTDVFGYYLADLTIPRNPHEQSGDIYEKCLSMNKIFYEDSCWDLLTKGPCDEGQWLVLDRVSDKVLLREPRPLRAKCTRRRCSESDVYWPRDGFCHDEESARRDRLCASSDTVLATDEYGEGYCKCHDGGKVPYVQVVSANDDGNQDTQPCYPVYSKGACPSNHVLTPHGTRYGICTVDECAKERRLTDSSSPMLQRSSSEQQRRQPVSLARWTDGQCYELGTRGPCTGHEQFAVLRATMRPDCVRLSIELTVLPKTTDRPGCKTDHWGNCEEGVEVSTTPNELKDALLKNAKKFSQRAQIRRASMLEVRRHLLQW
ncbi:uncharacterized protein LOC100574996 [Acyrthosiphon pisum]|uniref:DUF4789 domain-containing protein n=1 Tax=Acyrthosiphon pisum TaxID=7029 RepID=A0A8R2A4Y9_ACYPI|nr:uncharacterized protein LOC100574996 [Acyrthosiphon pisum]XP_008187838.1 uncharacterized protein LOC100574996 [Acyrthosiphon pisum]|eukprot:XP_003240756.1 PREDICTED: uncharacterized protein LOC100574996 [Acyrthosiphon pisum]